MAEGKPDDMSVVISILTWNGYELARACLESLTRLSTWPHPVIIVDNGSREPEGERLAREFGPPVEALSLSPNRAVAGGYNAALRRAAERGATHILLLNNDTVVQDPDLLSRLIAATGTDVAAVSPVTLNPDGSTYSAGGRFSWATGLSRHRRVPIQTQAPYPSPWLDGPCILVSIEAVKRIGGFDPVFVAYWEDADWCTRAARSGYRCLVQPRTTIVHLRGASVATAQAEALDLRNGILFMRRNGSLWNNLTALAFFLIVRAPVHVLRRADSPAHLRVALSAVVSALAWNVRDAGHARRWRLESAGPDLQDMPAPSP